LVVASAGRVRGRLDRESEIEYRRLKERIKALAEADGDVFAGKSWAV